MVVRKNYREVISELDVERWRGQQMDKAGKGQLKKRKKTNYCINGNGEKARCDF